MSEGAVPIVVLKFGGSLLRSDSSRRRAAESVSKRATTARVVVVVSAMGRGGDPYATDTLRALAPEPQSTADLAALDLLMACGEIISAAVFARALRSLDRDAVAIPAHHTGIVTTARYGCAQITRVDTSRLRHLLEAGVIPVVPGFIGISEADEITTLGRGGSDTSAAAIAAALSASSLELYKDVGAIHDVDPKRRPGARPLSHLSYEELAALARDVERPVIHTDAITIARRAGLRLIVRGLDTPKTTLVS